MIAAAILAAALTLAAPAPGRDRYGRTLARVVDRRGRDVGQALLSEGFAVPYHGRGPRHRWCA